MSTTIALPNMNAEHLLGEAPFLAPPSKETVPGRALRPNEVLSSDLPLVLVRAAEHGKEIVLPGYYACVGTMPCADTEYYLLVRWEHREEGRQGERRVVLQEHIRVLDPEGEPLTASGTPATASGFVPEDLARLTPASAKAIGQGSSGLYPQLRHSSKRKS